MEFVGGVIRANPGMFVFLNAFDKNFLRHIIIHGMILFEFAYNGVLNAILLCILLMERHS